MLFSGETMIRKLWRWVLCALGEHQWKRATRTLGDAGSRKCKHCPAVAPVRMRTRTTHTLKP